MFLNLTVLLLISAVLINFVLIITSQQDLINSEEEKGGILIDLLKHEINCLFLKNNEAINIDRFKAWLKQNISDENIKYLIVLDKYFNVNLLLGVNDISSSMASAIQNQIQESIRKEKTLVKSIGHTFGIIWEKDHYIIITTPLASDMVGPAGLGLVMNLDAVYKKVRRNQILVLQYILTNTIILAVLGFYRVSKIVLMPINRLVDRAEEYRGDDDIETLFAEDQGNEFNRLSRALNRMFARINVDNQKLKQTVASLEKANLDLNLAQKDIIRAEKLASVGRLASGIAHEIGNPIGIINGYLALLKQNDLGVEEKIDYLTRTENEINRVDSIIRQLLDFSRPSQRVYEQINVHEILSDTIEMLKVQPMVAKIDIHTRFEAFMDIVYADANQLKQVFLNVVLNAVDAMTAVSRLRKGRLDIKSEIELQQNKQLNKTVDMLRLEFKDNGPGIPSDLINNIFDPFYTTKEPGKGTGLGLSVSFMIIERFDGTIEAHSQEGVGTTMIITLPLLFKDKTVE